MSHKLTLTQHVSARVDGVDHLAAKAFSLRKQKYSNGRVQTKITQPDDERASQKSRFLTVGCVEPLKLCIWNNNNNNTEFLDANSISAIIPMPYYPRSEDNSGYLFSYCHL